MMINGTRSCALHPAGSVRNLYRKRDVGTGDLPAEIDAPELAQCLILAGMFSKPNPNLCNNIRINGKKGHTFIIHYHSFDNI